MTYTSVMQLLPWHSRLLRCSYVQHGAYYTLQGYQKQTAFHILVKCSMHHAGHDRSATSPLIVILQSNWDQ